MLPTFHDSVKDESLGLETKGTKTLSLVSDEQFWDSLVSVSSHLLKFYAVWVADESHLP